VIDTTIIHVKNPALMTPLSLSTPLFPRSLVVELIAVISARGHKYPQQRAMYPPVVVVAV
jgi:hypothetical protein